MQILFDSKKERHKKPFGCLRENEMCEISLHIPDCCDCQKAFLMVEDETGFSLRVPMVKGEEIPPYTHYTASFSLFKAGLYFYHFRIVGEKTTFSLYKRGDGTNMEEGDLWQVSCLPLDFHTPEDFRGVVFYQIFPDRFYRSLPLNTAEKKTDFFLHTDTSDTPEYRPDSKGEIKNCDFFGGNLRGIAEKLPYLASLSVGAIYLNPIFEAYSNHRYDTADYLKIDPLLGTEEDFRLLCEKTHALGIKVILDGVFSHTGSDSRYFDKENRYGGGAYHDPASPYREWYQFEEYPERYTSWWGINTLPATNELCPTYLDFIIRGEDSVIAHWLRAGADGFRLDVADELPDAFIALLRKRLKEIKPDALLIGEVWEDASNKISYSERRRYFTAGELDGVMNYPFRDSIIAFLQGYISANSVKETVMTICENYPSDVLPCLLNSISTHDTARILTLLSCVPTPASREERAHRSLNEEEMAKAIEKTLCAVFLQFVLPGSPCIYYGDEAGSEGYEDPFNRRFYPWGKENRELLAFHRAIAKLHSETEALRLGDCFVEAPQGETLLLRRTYKGKTVHAILTRKDSYPLPEGEILLAHGVENGAIKPYGFAIYQ